MTKVVFRDNLNAECSICELCLNFQVFIKSSRALLMIPVSDQPLLKINYSLTYFSRIADATCSNSAVLQILACFANSPKFVSIRKVELTRCVAGTESILNRRSFTEKSGNYTCKKSAKSGQAKNPQNDASSVAA
jgi:hypothetical protein